jgi:predicted CXXCH cytochrome family protein
MQGMIKYFITLIPVVLVAVLPGKGLHEKKTGDCLECHGDMLKKQNMHPGVDTGCLICHVATDTLHPGDGTMDFRLASPVPALCLECHTDIDENMKQMRYVHGPMTGEESCLACHQPHASDAARLLNEPSKELCISCHTSNLKGDSAIVKNVGQSIRTAANVHPAAAADGGCIICHYPHYGESRNLLTASFPTTRYAAGETGNYDVCFMCHDSDLLAADSTATATAFRNGSKNLHFLHSGGERGRNCTICHDVHASSGPVLIENSIRFGEWQARMNFIKTETGGSCATACHGLKNYDREDAAGKE